MRTKGYNIIDVTSDIKFEENIKRMAAKPKTPAAEVPYSSDLTEMGKRAYFEEYYNGIKLENQIFPKVGKFDDPRETECFKRGYSRGSEMVSTVERLNNTNIIPVEYREEAQKRFTK